MKNVRTIVVFVIGICLCVGYYLYLANRSSDKEEVLAEIQKLNSMDFELDYPKTPREVIRLYNRIEQCFYGEEYTEEEFEQLADQARELMDQELVDNNPRESYVSLLKEDIETHKKENKTILRISISSGNEVEYEERDGSELAFVVASYSMKVEKATERVTQTFILRKSEQGKWKILGFR